MPKETFLNLPTERQQRIDTILLDVFFNKHLSQVNVSEIVEKMQMSRGAFYKYFEDLEDAHHYIVKKYSAIIHQDILQYAMMDESNFFKGIRNYFTWCTHLDKNEDYWKGLVLLTRINYQSTVKQTDFKRDSIYAEKWMALLEKNHYQIDSPEEATRLLFFMMEMVNDSLTNWIMNEWSPKDFLQDFDYRIKWITQGIAKKRKEDENQ
ncbi:hypothetical protein GCM10011482_21860 [Enterococcus alcedinis]|uniref:HTH tetR-type domain-containing protein n=1 Tax=Enterococcus alcedinis TaxID=1274384 RepID=A0A917N737_9ENTE|nr:TetR/AcrR family transcriptional regulator [Enterococcus alcedinis]MBP2102995.1 AcrR family transcriptional regulator [Enterococcus alcedinis]GGI66532.1 hypothetical protein GCM10011482_21860 [Enterococcus alcedinis]